MNIFRFFSKKKTEPDKGTTHISSNEDTAQICSLCGKSFKMEFRFCPYCGKPSNINKHNKVPLEYNILRPGSMPNIQAVYNGTVDDGTLDYLKSIKRDHQARQLFDIKVCVPEKMNPVLITLPGASRSRDAINHLYETNAIQRGHLYRFTDWPRAARTNKWGTLLPACVCELPDAVFHLVEYEEAKMQVLYGCPSIFALVNHVPAKTIEVIDYVD